MKIIGIKLLKEGLGDGHLMMMKALSQSRQGLKDLNIDPNKDFKTDLPIDPKFSDKSNPAATNRLGTEIDLFCVFGKTQQDVLRNTADSIVINNSKIGTLLHANKQVPIYQAFNATNGVLKYSYTDRNLNVHSLEFKLLNFKQKVEAGKVYEISILKVNGFDQNLESTPTLYKYFILNHNTNTNKYSKRNPWS